MNVFLRLITYVRPYLGRVCVGIGATLVIIGLEAAQPRLMREVIDNILTPYFTQGRYIGDDFSDTKNRNRLRPPPILRPAPLRRLYTPHRLQLHQPLLTQPNGPGHPLQPPRPGL